MAGTKAGAMKARAKNLENDPDHYKKIGAIGGRNGHGGGFASDIVGADRLTGRERSRIAGVRGGTISRRKKKINV